MKNAKFSTTKDTKHTKGAHGGRRVSASLRLCVKKLLRAVGGALWLLWVLPGILVAACSASAEEEADARLKAIDGGAAR